MACGKVTFLTIFIVSCAFASVNGQKYVINLDEDNWTKILEDEWMVEFYAPWCPACQSLQKTWQEYANYAPSIGIKVGQVDVTTSPGLSGRFMVTALPTIFHVLKGEFRQYKGSRDKDSLISFVEDKKWEQVEPISSWKSPKSFQMSIVSSFFKLSQMLRQLHNKLMEEYGLPTWGSYLIFALATIILGAVLGLMLVCVIDLIYPQKTVYIAEPLKKKDKESDDEYVDYDLQDDLDYNKSQTEEETGSDSGSGEVTNSPKTRKRKAKKDN